MRASLPLPRLLAAAALVALAAGCHEPSAPLPGSDQPLALIAEAPLLDGTRLDSKALDGKVVVVSFWSPGCGICMRELPELQHVAQSLRERGLELVTVMLEGNPRAGRLVADRLHLHAPIIVGDDPLRLKMNVTAYPWTLILDRTGKPLHAIRGARSPSQLRKEFERRL